MDGSHSRYTYGITGMHCAGCVKTVADALRHVDGVTAAAVTLDPPEVRLETAGVVTQAQLDAALAPFGKYRLLPAGGQTAGSASTAMAAGDADGVRFRGGISGGGGALILDPFTFGLGGVDGRLGVQINDPHDDLESDRQDRSQRQGQPAWKARGC